MVKIYLTKFAVDFFLNLQPIAKNKPSGAVTRSSSASPKRKVREKSASTKRTTRSKSASVRPEVDILSQAAVINAYYISHDVTDCLGARGFPWDGAKKGRKKKKKKS